MTTKNKVMSSQTQSIPQTTMQDLNNISLNKLVTICQNLNYGVAIGNNGEVAGLYKTRVTQ